MKHGSLFWIAQAAIDTYADIYPQIKNKAEEIKKEIDQEEQKFRKTLDLGLKQFEKGENPFVLFTSYGFPFELTKELAKEKGVEIDETAFNEEMKKHQDLSRAGSEQKFKGGLGDTSEKSLQYHTATHLLHQALRDVLGNHVSQKGSNITPERLRFDFTHTAKMTDEEKKKVEEIVNEKIQAALPMQVATLPKEEAEKTGALHFFGDKYGDTVTVYYVGNDLEHAYSKEFCGGPHVKNTSDLKGVFKIQKEEAVSAGVRRIKAMLE
jgi:alanyl-tRNA synthetase